MQTRANVETQLKLAQDALTQRTQLLAGRQVEGKKQLRLDPTYRQLDAEIRKYRRRLESLDRTATVEADLVQRRAERAATPKQPKEKKKAAAPATPKAVKAKREKKA